MTAIERVAPRYALECNNLKCLAVHRPVAPGADRSPKMLRRDATLAGWQVRPEVGPGSRHGEDFCPEHRTDGHGIAYTFTPAPNTVEAWNAAHQIGTLVRAYPGLRGDRFVIGPTRSPAWKPGDAPLVMVKGLVGGIALTHIDIAITPEEATDGV